ADVIKVEPPRGDPWRGYQGPDQDSSGPFTTNYAFEVDNRGKRSITLDLKHRQAREVAIKLAEGCDVFVTNLLPRRRKQFGLDYQVISSRNPRVVYLSFSGYGDRGPEGDRLGMDFGAFWARSGIMGLMESLAERLGISYLYITHDLAVARYMCTRISVMYLGKIVETGETEEVLHNPIHP
ncbi:MAG: CoA transferase, partial [Chloroflexi bacterium]|nr:CoA transferase [Chloroflexota bacterium]